MPKKRKQPYSVRKNIKKELQRAKRRSDINNSSGALSGNGDPAPSWGKSLNALRLAPPQGSLPTQAKGIPPWSDSLQCVCAPMSAPSPKCEAGQAQLADSLPSVCTPERVSSPPCDAASRILTKDAWIIEQDIEKTHEHQKTDMLVEQFKPKNDTDSLTEDHDSMPRDITPYQINVVQGSFHQGYSLFGPNAGKQCVANSLSCIAYSVIHPVENWSHEDIDRILYSGNELYSFLQSSSTIQNNYLLVNELPNNLEIFECNMKFHYDNPLVGLLRDTVDKDLHDCDISKMNMSLNSAFKVCFLSNRYCFVSFGGNTFAIVYLRNAYHVFDSHSRAPDGTARANGKAILLSFVYIEDVVLHCYNLAKSLGIQSGIQFEITAVNALIESCIMNSTCNIRKPTSDNGQSVEQCEVEISASEYVPHLFRPLDITSKNHAMDRLTLFSKKDCVSCTLLHNLCSCQPVRNDLKVKVTNTPSALHKINGDGNCLFRAVSYSIFGTEDHHKCFRHITCDFLQQNQDFVLKHTSVHSTSIEYLKQSHMYTEGTWATAIEIIALSAILETSIYTYTSNKWLRYKADNITNDHGIYLNHTNGNHYDVVLDVMDKESVHAETPNTVTVMNAKSLEKDGQIGSRKNHNSICNEMMEKYFSHQKDMQIMKGKTREHLSRKQYMKKYMHNWRKKGKNRQAKLNEDRIRKQKARQDPLYRAKETTKKREKIEKTSLDIGDGLNEECESKKKELERDQLRKRKSRRNLSFRRNEKTRDREARSKARNEEKRREDERQKERNCKQNERQNEIFRKNEKGKDRNARSNARKDEQYRTRERIREKEGKLFIRQNETFRKIEKEKDRMARSTARKDEDIRKKEREREKIWKIMAREDDMLRSIERIKEKESKINARQNEEYKKLEQKRDQEARANARKDHFYCLKERQRESLRKRKARASTENQETERHRDNDRKRKLREDICFKENERKMKSAKRADAESRLKERLLDNTNKAKKRKNVMYVEMEKEAAKKRRYGKNLSECVAKFKSNIKEGPIYVCTCCHQTWFSHSVTNSSSIQKQCKNHELQECFSYNITSVRDTEWICNTCKLSINQGKVPKLAIANKIGFPRRPTELDLHQLEERLVALRIPFMQIRELPRGGQLSIKGNVVNVPVDVQPTVKSLPRPFDENITVSVRLKKKLSYKSCDLTENVRPMHVISALHWLMKHSDLYQSSGIEIDDDWMSRITRTSQDIVKEYLSNRSLDKENATCKGDIDKSNERSKEESNEEETDEFVEIDERETNSGNCDTVIDDANLIHENVYSFAPGEGQSPLGLYKDPDSEYLSFPSIYCGQRRPENHERHVKVNYSDIVKWELRSVDRRAAQNIPNIFYKMKKIQMKQISDKVNLVLRRCKTEGKKITAKDVLDPEKAENLARLDEGYFIFRTLRNSPPYLEGKKKELFAMIRQLGLPTWFVSLSAADTRWVDQLSMLSKLNTGITLNAEDVDKMTWAEKTDLVKKDPVNSVRYFNHRVQEFITTVLKSDHNPVGKVTDFFYRVEFQHRGSPHIHMLLWIENAPVYQKDSLEDVTAFIDKYVSCSRDVKSEEKEFVEMQLHRHSKSCKKRGKNICRFNFPLPPMPRTTILEPLDEEDLQKYRKLYNDIQKHLSKEKTDDFQNLLKTLEITEEEYVKAIRSSLQGPKVLLQRQSNEIRVNPYMKNLLTAWGANHDLQFVLDPFACVVYIVNYISKAQRGMSTLLDEACKEARDGNSNLKRQVRHVGNKFLNCVEVSAQEASYLNLQLPLTQSTRDCVFINTAPPSQRTFLLKQKEQLEKLPEDSTDIEAENIIKRYAKRPKILENWCLADYAAELNIVFPKKENIDNLEEDVNDDDVEHETEEARTEKDYLLNITLKNGIKIKQRLTSRLIRYVRYSLKVDPENFFRERILLFFPWRNEDIDVLGSFESYEEHYMTVKTTILPKVAKYEKNAEDLDRAQILASEICSEDQLSEIAPGNEQSQLDAAAEGSQESKSFAVFDPRRPDNQRNYDIGPDLGLPVCDVTHGEETLRRMPNDDYFAKVRTLNIKQRDFFLHVLHWIQTKKEPLRVFLTGGAGVGKSVVVRLLHEALSRQFGSQDGQNPDLLRVLLCAPTGKAAYNIGGVTIHSAFGIPASQGFKCKPLTSDSLNSMRTKYRHLNVVIIDEVSMVGNMMFNLIHERLKQIRGSKKYFGGLHVILIGDLFQLKPVMDGWIFENLKSDFGPLATNLWQDLFNMHELTEIMRQKDDINFAELLNRLREGNHANADLEILKSRSVGTSFHCYPRMAPHLFISNKSVNDFNIQVYNSVQNEKTVVKSMDCFFGGHKSLNNKLQSLPKDASKTAGLHSDVYLGTGLKYEVTANLSVSDGITNGTSCTLKLIDRKQINSSRPSIIWVLFEKPCVGIEWRNQYRHLYTDCINKLWTPIFDVKRTFTYLRHNVMRIQFPLRIAAAKTVHKSQGDTVDELVVDLTANYKLPHVHYVALSRVRNMTGLNVLALNEQKISVSDKVRDEKTQRKFYTSTML